MTNDATERKAFEEIIRANPADPPGCLAKDADGDYCSMFIHARWSAFRAGCNFARASLESTPSNMTQGQSPDRELMEGLAEWLLSEAAEECGSHERKLRRWASEVEACRNRLAAPVTVDDFVEHVHRDYGPGYFCTPDVLDRLAAKEVSGYGAPIHSPAYAHIPGAKEGGGEPVAWALDDGEEIRVTAIDPQTGEGAYDGYKIIPLYASPSTRLPSPVSGDDLRAAATAAGIQVSNEAPNVIGPRALRSLARLISVCAAQTPDGEQR